MLQEGLVRRQTEMAVSSGAAPPHRLTSSQYVSAAPTSAFAPPAPPPSYASAVGAKIASLQAGLVRRRTEEALAMGHQPIHALNPSADPSFYGGQFAPGEIDASRVQRRRASNVVGRALARRPTVEDLQEKGVMKKGGVSAGLLARQVTGCHCHYHRHRRLLHHRHLHSSPAGLLARQQALQKQLEKDAFNYQLASRPTADDLVAAGILHAPPGVAPNLVAKQEALQKQLMRDAMNHALMTRPSAEALTEAGILKAAPGAGVSARIADAQEHLMRKIREEAIEVRANATPERSITPTPARSTSPHHTHPPPSSSLGRRPSRAARRWPSSPTPASSTRRPASRPPSSRSKRLSKSR